MKLKHPKVWFATYLILAAALFFTAYKSKKYTLIIWGIFMIVRGFFFLREDA